MKVGWFRSTSMACCALFVVNALLSEAVNKSYGNSLDEYLFKTGYNKDVRPFIDKSRAVKVHIALSLTTIVELNEVSQSFSVTGWIMLIWKDDRLSWNPSEFGNITTIYRSPETVWLPDITLFNYYADVVDFDKKFLRVMVRFDGSLLWNPGGVFKAPCTIRVEKFPFDTQTCDLRFGSWSFDVTDIDLQNSSSEIDVGVLKSNGNNQWDYLDSSASIISGKMGPISPNIAVFKMSVRRKPIYCLVNYVLPVIVLAVLAVFVFQLSVEGGGKLSYAITVLLAFSVYLSFLGDILPKTSDTTSLFSIYVSSLFLCSALFVIITVFILKLAEKQTEVNAIGRCLVQLASKLHGIEYKTQYLTNEPEGDNEGKEMHKGNIGTVVTWGLVTKAVDFFLFYIFLGLIAFLTALIFSLQLK